MPLQNRDVVTEHEQRCAPFAEEQIDRDSLAGESFVQIRQKLNEQRQKLPTQ